MNFPLSLIVAIATSWMGRVSGTSSPEALLALMGNNNEGLASAVLVRDGQPLRRQLQQHEDFCDLLYDWLIVLNPGASCECKRGAATFTCVNPPKCIDEVSCSGEICGFVTSIYGYTIEGNWVSVDTERPVLEYTSGGGSLRGEETQTFLRTDRCNFFMSTLDGLRYQCNGCSKDCPGEYELNVDCSNIQADSTTGGQCVSLRNTSADLGLLTNFCVEGPIVPTTLPVPVPSAATDLSTGYDVLAITAALICALLMVTCHIIVSSNRARRERMYLQLQ